MSGVILGTVLTFAGAAEELRGVSPVAKLAVQGVPLGSIAEPWGLLRAAVWGLAGCTKAWGPVPAPPPPDLSSVLSTGLREQGW